MFPLVHVSSLCRVIPSHHKQIAQSVKQIILDYIFETSFINQYIMNKISQLATTADFPERINSLLASEEVDGIIDSQLASLTEIPEGQFLKAIGMQPTHIKPMVKPFVLGMGSEVAPLLLDHVTKPGKVS